MDERHWDGLPDGTGPGQGPAVAARSDEALPEPLATLTCRAPAVGVARRAPAAYDALFALEAR